MDRRLRNLLIFFSLAFLALTANLTYLQFFKAEELLSSRHNTRSLAEELSIKRGSIITADGVELSQSERVSGRKYERFYPEGEAYSAITGFYDSRYGRFGLEQRYNNQLLGRDSADTLADYIDRIAGRGRPGNDLILTIDSKIQQAAYQSLIGKKGAVVAIEPDTGAILAIASYPSYNPNTLRKDWKKLVSDKDSPLVNRALYGLYPPGSSFKAVTLTAALAKGKTNPSKLYPGPSVLKVYGGTVTNYKSKSYGLIPLNTAFKQSVNTVFARVGLDTGSSALVDQAESFGFNSTFNFDLDYKRSLVKKASEMDDLEVAWTAVGQAHTLATPLQMAMVTSGIANKGRLMQPYLVKRIRDYQGRSVEKREPQEMSQVVSADKARVVRNLMIEVVEGGTGRAAAIPNVMVAGKTGTAEVKGKRPHAWFIGFAPALNPQIAVAVLVENSGTGGSIAAPIARQVIKKALNGD